MQYLRVRIASRLVTLNDDDRSIAIGMVYKDLDGLWTMRCPLTGPIEGFVKRKDAIKSLVFAMTSPPLPLWSQALEYDLPEA